MFLIGGFVLRGEGGGSSSFIFIVQCGAKTHRGTELPQGTASPTRLTYYVPNKYRISLQKCFSSCKFELFHIMPNVILPSAGERSMKGARQRAIYQP